MKSNGLNGSEETEKILRDKMNELSLSVDCFDRISAKAFPEKKADFSESGFVVCDLENITGKSRKTHFLRRTALAVAVAVCVAVIPRTSLIDKLMANLGKSAGKTYNKIIDEINRETAENDYRVYDIPLDDYISYDRLVNPLYPCPFADLEKEDINVRIFVRMYGDYPTNQMYAVEYTGEYQKSNFIAVAETEAKFTEEDFTDIEIDKIIYGNTSVYDALKTNFSADTTSIKDKSGKSVSAGSFDYVSIFKSKEEVYPLLSQVLYYGDSDGTDYTAYQYDINNTSYGGETTADVDGIWKNSIRYDGFSAKSETDESLFNRTELFNKETAEDYNKETTEYIMCLDITPSIVATEKKNSVDENGILKCSTDIYEISYNRNGLTAGSLVAPYDFGVAETFRMYFSNMYMIFSSSSENEVYIKSQTTGNGTSVDIDWADILEVMAETEAEEQTAEADLKQFFETDTPEYYN
ncbi:MAG: hypothetical protein K2J08_13175 [Ruminococcus sp.]|nr:hypothetical protein [Ruminococcus sp.]